MEKTAEKYLVVAVDDEPDFLAVLRRMLTPRYDFVSFTSGEGVLEQLEVLRPDALLLDVHMPGNGGVRLCREVRSDPRFASLPILFLTASRDDMDFIDTMKAGGDAYLNKPVGHVELNTRLREMLTLPSETPTWVNRS